MHLHCEQCNGRLNRAWGSRTMGTGSSIFKLQHIRIVLGRHSLPRIDRNNVHANVLYTSDLTRILEQGQSDAEYSSTLFVRLGPQSSLKEFSMRSVSTHLLHYDDILTAIAFPHTMLNEVLQVALVLQICL